MGIAVSDKPTSMKDWEAKKRLVLVLGGASGKTQRASELLSENPDVEVDKLWTKWNSRLSEAREDHRNGNYDDAYSTVANVNYHMGYIIGKLSK